MRVIYRMSVTVLFIMSIAITLSSTMFAEECNCSNQDPPSGYYASANNPVVISGGRIWSPESTVSAIESNMAAISTWRTVVESAVLRSINGINYAELAAGKYIVVNLRLYALNTSSLAPTQMIVETSTGLRAQPVLIIPSPVSINNVFSCLYVFEKESFLPNGIKWVKITVSSGSNAMQFSIHG